MALQHLCCRCVNCPPSGKDGAFPFISLRMTKSPALLWRTVEQGATSSTRGWHCSGSLAQMGTNRAVPCTTLTSGAVNSKKGWPPTPSSPHTHTHPRPAPHLSAWLFSSFFPAPYHSPSHGQWKNCSARTCLILSVLANCSLLFFPRSLPPMIEQCRQGTGEEPSRYHGEERDNGNIRASWCPTPGFPPQERSWDSVLSLFLQQDVAPCVPSHTHNTQHTRVHPWGKGLVTLLLSHEHSGCPFREASPHDRTLLTFQVFSSSPWDPGHVAPAGVSVDTIREEPPAEKAGHPGLQPLFWSR